MMTHDILSEVSNPREKKIERRTGILAYPFDWQEPAATERAAYESVVAYAERVNSEYVAFPWATLIDNLRSLTSLSLELLIVLNSISKYKSDFERRVTVAQHINTLNFIHIFKAIGITDIYWSHATRAIGVYDGVNLHPFPLFPAQAHDLPEVGSLIDVNRKYLANFIGAYNPGLYISNVREVIFNSANDDSDLYIVKRGAWYFDRAVYAEQVNGVGATKSELVKEDSDRDEYLEAIKESWFTLCPTGAGPNSIRLFESLSLGSIPILLSKELRLPGSLELWEASCIIEDDSEVGYRRAIETARRMTVDKRVQMILSGRSLAAQVFPNAYSKIIFQS